MQMKAFLTLALKVGLGFKMVEHQNGGASSMVIGHNTLMKVIDHMGERGVKTSRFLFHPTDKAFAFGGSARREALWSVRLPI